MAVKKWVWVAGGAAAFLVLLVVALIGFGVYFVSRHVLSGPASLAEAQHEFDRIRAQYAGRPPLIEFAGEESEPVVHREALSDSAGHLESLDVLAWDPRHPRLVRISIPFWLVRLSPGRLNISGTEPVEFRRLHLTAADLERYGPGILLDFEPPHGGRVLAVVR